MSVYHILVRRGLKADLPADGLLGELFYCTDTTELFVGEGTGLPLSPVAGTPGGGGGGGGGGGTSIAGVLTVTSTDPGDFFVAHGLAAVPSAVIPVVTGDGTMRTQVVPADATNVYLNASDAGLSGIVYLLT